MEESKIKEEISLKTLSITFFLGLIFLFGLYYFVFREDINIASPVTFEESDLKFIKKPKTVEELNGFVIEDFDNVLLNKFSIIPDKEGSFSKISISDETFEGEGQSLKIEYGIVKDGYVIFQFPLNIKDWSAFENVNVLIKTQGKGGGVNFLIEEEDKDCWVIFNTCLLSQKGWNLLKIPFKELSLCEWRENGDRKMDLKNLREFRFNYLSLEGDKVKGEALIDTIFLD